ncbi:MAG: efflux RND transporter periplasmic adaptor subunit [Thermosynechococcaceae cyanobacterium]
MEARTGIALALLLVGCTQPQVLDESPEPIIAVSPTIAPQPARQQRDAPRRLKLRLTLDRPEDLKVKVQDSVVRGQVISDRTSTRTNLTRERETLRQQLKQLQVQVTTPSFAVEQAEVEQARLKVEQAKVAIANFRTNSPWTDYARSVLPISEGTQLRQLRDQHLDAKGELMIAVAKLQEVRRQKIMHTDGLQRQVELLGKVQEIERQLESREVVRSPYDGIIKSIKWVGQTGQELQVELTLAIDATAALL